MNERPSFSGSRKIRNRDNRPSRTRSRPKIEYPHIISSVTSDFTPDIVEGYKNVQIIGKGAFGQVWKAKKIDEESYYAIKFERKNISVPQVISEAKQYQDLAKGATDFLPIPKVFEYGRLENCNYMVMQLLGDSLEDIKSHYFKLKDSTVLLLASQMIKAMEYIHKRGYVYRDVKPDNFLTGHNMEKSNIYLIDFGLAKKYIDSSGKHIKKFSGGSLTGTPRYASINATKGKTQSRRDDMQALSYVFSYLLKGRLPWQGLPTDPKDKYKNILNKKLKASAESLFDGHDKAFIKYHKIVSKLKFYDEPDYDLLSNIMLDAVQNYQSIGFEWAIVIQKKLGDRMVQTGPKSSLLLYQGKETNSMRTQATITKPVAEPSSINSTLNVIKKEQKSEIIQFDNDSFILRRVSKNDDLIDDLKFPMLWGWNESIDDLKFPIFPNIPNSIYGDV